jgi:hypothetical protein
MAETGGAKAAAPRRILSTTIYVLELAIIATIYIGLANTAPLVRAVDTIHTASWPPSGVALALVLLRVIGSGPRFC